MNRTGQLFNFSSLASDSWIAVETARRWISILKTSFLVFLLRPHHRNFNKRVIRSPKLYFHDTGLACQLLGIKTREQLIQHPLRGALFENYVIAETQKNYIHHREDPPRYSRSALVRSVRRSLSMLKPLTSILLARCRIHHYRISE